MAAALAPPGDIGGMTEETTAAGLLLLRLAVLTEFMTTEDPGLECCDDPDPDESDVEMLPAPLPAAAAIVPLERRASSTRVHGCASWRAQ